MAEKLELVRDEPGGMAAAVSRPSEVLLLQTISDGRWRVVESSSVILLLLDSRCPVLHCPPSLRTYLQSLKPHKEVVLVLTKADLVDPSALEQWKEWVKGWWGQPVEVASVTSYDLEYLNGGVLIIGRVV